MSIVLKDWVVYTTEQGLKYDFIVHSGANPNLIQMRFKDHEGLKINEDGSFTLSNRMGSITEQAPISFQSEQVIKTVFRLEEDVISFQIDAYDPTQKLVIDPSLIWATYHGGVNDDSGYGCTVDSMDKMGHLLWWK